MDHVTRKRQEFEKALKLYKKDTKQWIRYAQFEIDNGNYSHARSVFERALDVDYTSTQVWLRYAQFEQKHNAGAQILERAVELLPKETELWKKLLQFSNNKEDILSRHAQQNPNELIEFKPEVSPTKSLEICNLQDSIELCSNDIDLWMATLSIKETDELYAKAVEMCLPKSKTKSLEWRKYAVLNCNYATFSNNPQVYEQALKRYDHSLFSSTLLWTEYANFYLNQNDVSNARKVFGSALGKTRKCIPSYVHILREYIVMEAKLNNLEKCRKLYEMLVTTTPEDVNCYLEYAEFELEQNEFERAVYILRSPLHLKDLQLNNNKLYYYLTELVDLENARLIFEDAVLHATDLTDAYMQYAMFELSVDFDEKLMISGPEGVAKARDIFKRGLKVVNDEDLVDYYKQFNEKYPEKISAVEKLLMKANKWNEEKLREST